MLRTARNGERRQGLLAEFPFAEQMFEGDDLTLGQWDLRGAPLDGLDLSGADIVEGRPADRTAAEGSTQTKQ